MYASVEFQFYLKLTRTLKIQEYQQLSKRTAPILGTIIFDIPCPVVSRHPLYKSGLFTEIYQSSLRF
jgi:hypothetical protein